VYENVLKIGPEPGQTRSVSAPPAPQPPEPQPAAAPAVNIGTEPPELHRGVLEGLSRAYVDHALELGDRIQQFVDQPAGGTLVWLSRSCRVAVLGFLGWQRRRAA
jgi:hypothetical protein